MEQLRIRSHGRYGLEVKSRYILGNGTQDERDENEHRRQQRKRQSYDVGMYLFFPYSFNVNPSTYPRDTFFEDLKLYLRFDTPGFSVEDLLDESSDTSPLVRCERMVEEAEQSGNKLPYEPFSYESKILANVFKSLLRDWYY